MVQQPVDATRCKCATAVSAASGKARPSYKTGAVLQRPLCHRERSAPATWLRPPWRESCNNRRFNQQAAASRRPSAEPPRPAGLLAGVVERLLRDLTEACKKS